MSRDPTRPLGNQKALGRAIVELRTERNLSSEALAEQADVDVELVKSIEAGEGDPNWNTVAFLARAMDVHMGDLSKLHDAHLDRADKDGT